MKKVLFKLMTAAALCFGLWLGYAGNVLATAPTVDCGAYQYSATCASDSSYCIWAKESDGERMGCQCKYSAGKTNCESYYLCASVGTSVLCDTKHARYCKWDTSTGKCGCRGVDGSVSFQGSTACPAVSRGLSKFNPFAATAGMTVNCAQYNANVGDGYTFNKDGCKGDASCRVSFTGTSCVCKSWSSRNPESCPTITPPQQ